MPISDQTQAVLAYFDDYTGGNVRKANDIGSLLETASELDAADEFNGIVFAGKVVWSLYSTLRNAMPTAPAAEQASGDGDSSSSDSTKNLEREFASGVQDLRERLLFFAANTTSEQRSRFEQTYLGLNPGTLKNLTDLAHDLARFKDMQSEQKRA